MTDVLKISRKFYNTYFLKQVWVTTFKMFKPLKQMITFNIP